MSKHELKVIHSEVASTNSDFIQKTENILSNINETGQSIFNSIDRITQTIERVKELDFQIKELEARFLLKSKEYDFRIEKVKANKDIIQSVLNRSSNTIDKLLDAILEMDETNNDPSLLKKREELLEQLRISSDNLSLMFISFLKV